MRNNRALNDHTPAVIFGKDYGARGADIGDDAGRGMDMSETCGKLAERVYRSILCKYYLSVVCDICVETTRIHDFCSTEAKCHRGHDTQPIHHTLAW